MKYTAKSGKELPPEVVEVIEKEQARQLMEGIIPSKEGIWGLHWTFMTAGLYQPLINISHNDDFTEFYKLYPKKDLDSYGNHIVKGEIVEVKHIENGDWVEREFFGIADKSTTGIYGVYDSEYKDLITFEFCRKINSNASKKSELESQMNDLLTKANELKQKINEL